jgi:hypothetical protein
MRCPCAQALPGRTGGLLHDTDLEGLPDLQTLARIEPECDLERVQRQLCIAIPGQRLHLETRRLAAGTDHLRHGLGTLRGGAVLRDMHPQGRQVERPAGQRGQGIDKVARHLLRPGLACRSRRTGQLFQDEVPGLNRFDVQPGDRRTVADTKSQDHRLLHGFRPSAA